MGKEANLFSHCAQLPIVAPFFFIMNMYFSPFALSFFLIFVVNQALNFWNSGFSTAHPVSLYYRTLNGDRRPIGGASAFSAVFI